MAEDEGQVLAAAKKLPWPERIAHKNWKVRSDAYSDIRQTCERAFSAEDPCFSEFGEGHNCTGTLVYTYHKIELWVRVVWHC
jgi:hypothetical protein